jgi:hypothetical protein
MGTNDRPDFACPVVAGRVVAPLIWQPGMVPGQDTTFGLGDTELFALISPVKPGSITLR